MKQWGVIGMESCDPAGPNGDALVLLGAAAAIQMAQGRTADEIELLSAFFEVLGDNLALIAARRVEAAAGDERRMNRLKPQDTDCQTDREHVKWKYLF